jgi:hypothetical protein
MNSNPGQKVKIVARFAESFLRNLLTKEIIFAN